jgi:hypothetical protein
MRVRRWQIGSVTICLAILGGLINWVYTHPPLSSGGGSSAIGGGKSHATYDLWNQGWGPVVLRGVRVDASPAPASITTVRNQGGEMASSKAMRPAELTADQVGAVPGWRISPQSDLHITNALALRWSERLLPERPYSVELSYWYLGLPMRLHIEGFTADERMKPLPPAPPQPDVTGWATGDPARRPVIREVRLAEPALGLTIDGWFRTPPVRLTFVAETERATNLILLGYDPFEEPMNPDGNTGFRSYPNREAIPGGERWTTVPIGLNAHGLAVYAVAENEFGRTVSPVLYLQNWPQ